MASIAGPEFIGRDEEYSAIAGFLAARDRFPGALLLEGEAGIGKTTLFRQALAVAAHERAFRVLECSPAGAERRLSFAAAGDLLEDVLEDVLPELPLPQQRALRVTFLLDEADGRPPDRRAISLGFLGALRALARETDVLVAIDDVQWLDASSAALVEFAVRRLRDERIALLLTQRTEGNGGPPLGLERAFPEERLLRISVGPLSVGALHHLITTRLGITCSRPTLRRIDEVSGGNPFFALELARAWQSDGGRPAAGHDLPVPVVLQQLVEKRLGDLPPDTQESLLVAASVAEPRLALIEAAVGRPPNLEPALEAQVIELDGDRIRFAHPLLESAVRGRAPAERRRAVHRTLSRLVPSPEEQARQLALATEGPDEAVAATLHAAARDALRHGAPRVTAELLEHALRFTPDGAAEARVRRTLEASAAHFEDGDTAHAMRLLEELAATMPAGRDRAEVLWRLGGVKGEVASTREALAAYEQALAEAGDDVRLRASVYCHMAWLEACVGNQENALGQALAGIELAESSGDPDLIAEALAAEMLVDLFRGVRNDTHATRALDLERAGGRVRIDRCASTVRGYQLLYAGELDDARSHFENVLRLARERGDESNASAPLFSLAALEVLAGDWTRAAEHVGEAEERAEQTGVNRLETLFVRTLLDVHEGRVEDAGAEGAVLLEAAGDAGEQLSLLRCLGLLGFLELSCADAAAAHVHLARAGRVAVAMGIRAPGYLRFLADDAEALVALGDLDGAEAALLGLEGPAVELEHAWALSLVDRSRGLLLGARGETDAALETLARALARQDGLGMPFEHARTLLALGLTQRRARQRGAARTSLGEALAGFEHLGARLWAERARGELARIGGRAAGSGELTPTERRVAEIVAGGGSNKEAAAALFVSVKSIEANLSRVYAKLGVRSRTELARRLESKM